jgi:cyclic pyranopterin phosphate synthase
MPEKGINFVHRKDLLSYEEMLDLCSLLAEMGIEKVRITGGEPFVRKGAMDFIEKLSLIKGINEIHLTTNGVSTLENIPRLKAIGLAGVNLSLDTLNREKFIQISRRDHLAQVMETFHAFLDAGIKTKINMVVMDGVNDDEIISMAELTRQYPVQVRFLEEMPFNGGSKKASEHWNHTKILNHLKTAFPFIIQKETRQNATSTDYQIPGAVGYLGIIASFSRTFCGTCNRIRITPQGQLKTCLYGDGVLNIRDLMRETNNDHEIIKSAFLKAFGNRAKDGHEAEKNRIDGSSVSESMSSIGG